MSPLPRADVPSWHLSPDPHSGIAIVPLLSPGAPQRLGVLELRSHRLTAPAPTPLPCTQAETARNAHLKVMGELTVSIAHEICQPLLAIASNAAACVRWLQRDTPNLDEAIDGLSDIRKDCERAAGIVAALRALAKQSTSAPQAVDVNEVILEAARLHTPSLSHHNITLDIELHAEHPVIADPVQIQQLVFNLIANAMEAVGAHRSTGGVLRVSSKSLRDGVQVSVEDNGPGIPVEARQQIFDAFYTTKTSGLGMGLTICRSVIEAHKGNLYAEASELGGAMIRFQLPMGCAASDTRTPL
ncbi:sensor histidine kinase [Pseudomonas sp. Pseu.R1]|uniref:sensor histidine kinase n=1 Tax=Pseudomonas sp. Pseu.R1 TaxID=3379818 RepID=UPI003B946504